MQIKLRQDAAFCPFGYGGKRSFFQILFAGRCK